MVIMMLGIVSDASLLLMIKKRNQGPAQEVNLILWKKDEKSNLPEKIPNLATMTSSLVGLVFTIGVFSMMNSVGEMENTFMISITPMILVMIQVTAIIFMTIGVKKNRFSNQPPQGLQGIDDQESPKESSGVELKVLDVMELESLEIDSLQIYPRFIY